MKIYIVDRIEGKYAICEQEDRSMVSILLSKLPSGIQEGSCFKEENGIFSLDPSEEKKRRESNAELQRRLFE